MSVQEYAQRLRNTRTFTFDNKSGNKDGGNNNKCGDFDCVIPPHPYPQDVIASRAIFKLKSFYAVEQTDEDRILNDIALDISGYFIQISGAGINQGVITNTLASGKSQSFPIYNKDGGSTNDDSQIYQRISGGEYNGEDVLCSNPYGTIINVKVFSMDEEKTIVENNDDIKTQITFSIELVPDN